jgi:multidrug efflux pump
VLILTYIDRVMQRLEMAVAGADPQTIAVDAASAARSTFAPWPPRALSMQSGLAYSGPSDLENIKTIYMKGVVSPRRARLSIPTPPAISASAFLISRTASRIVARHGRNAIRKRVEDIPGGKVTIAMEEEGPPTGAPINIEIAGDDFAVLGEIAKK